MYPCSRQSTTDTSIVSGNANGKALYANPQLTKDFLHSFIYRITLKYVILGYPLENLVRGEGGTPPIAEILCVKNVRAIVVFGFLMK